MDKSGDVKGRYEGIEEGNKKIEESKLNIFFQTKEDAEHYAKKHNLKIVEYKDD